MWKLDLATNACCVAAQSSLTMDGLELSQWLAVTRTQPGEAVTPTALKRGARPNLKPLINIVGMQVRGRTARVSDAHFNSYTF